jgi:hypothetical protein
MAGDGRYSASSATQHTAAAAGLALIDAAVDDAAVAAQGPPLLLADFGAATGTNSLEPIGAALRALRRRAPSRPVYVVHADIVGNDFTTLATVLETSPQRYAADDPHVLPLMAARSLYDPVLPADQLAFGWTASTLHWLSRAPGDVRGHFFVQLSDDAAARGRYAERSAADWRAFLDGRAAELAPGASVVAVDVLMGDDGLMGSEALFDRLADALRGAHADGALTPEELDRIVYPTWFRTLAELRAPFAPEYRAAGGQRLALVHVEPVIEPDPFADLLDDPPAYAEAQVGFLRGFLEPSFTAALDPERGDAGRGAALERVWTRARDLVAADPRAVSPAYRLVALRVRRLPD